MTPLLSRFAERFPIPTMARALLERCLNPQQLDVWFEAQAEGQYTRTLLFSTVFDLMMQVVSRQHNSVHAAYQAAKAPIGVSIKSVYNKLNGLEPQTSAALVRYSGEQVAGVIAQTGGGRPEPVPGYRVKILDGNALAGREHRLKETRATSAAPLPGKALLVFDPVLEAIIDCEPSDDAYTQERALLPAVLARMSARDLVVADRNFCTQGFFGTLSQRAAVGLVREHGQLRFRTLGPIQACSRVEGAEVAEQRVSIPAPDGSGELTLRRLVLRLDEPTREGDTTLYLLSTVPPEAADALTLARLYRQRWGIEAAFLHLTVQLRCEIHTLGYPPAALFALAVAVVAYNVLAMIKASLRAVYGAEAIDEGVSGYYLVTEMVHVAETLNTLIAPQEWAVFQNLSRAVLAAWLIDTARAVQLRKYRKHPRGPKKPSAKRTHDPKRSHTSTARLLAQRKKTGKANPREDT